MAKRRGHGEGSIYEWNGRYYAQLDLGRDPSGKRVRPRRTARSRAEAVSKLKEMERAVARGELTGGRPSFTMVGEWLQAWLDGEVAQRAATLDLRRSTVANYRRVVTRHLQPRIGALKLVDFKSTHVRQLHVDLAGSGLAPASVHEVHRVLRTAMNAAVRDEVIPRSPVAQVRAPRVEPKPVQPLTVSQAHKLMESLSGQRNEALYIVLLSCGLRVGEVLGLRWQDVDLGGGALTVTQQLQRRAGRVEFSSPKSARSRRTITLPDLARDALRRHRVRQREEQLAADYWEEHGLVFPSSNGRPGDSSNLNRDWRKVRDPLGLSHVRLHDLRHAAASFALAGGVQLRAVAELLGHSDTRLTADTYSHVLDAVRNDTAARISGVLEGRG